MIETERGNTWLIDDNRHYFVADQGDGKWLEITINPANYPGFVITEITATEADVVKNIHEKWAGAEVQKCNLNGVEIEAGCIIEPQE